jgi:Domain of unknown function (DUF4388)
MALTGELTDLSLAELIEFFCNQRKTGRLKVVYPTGPGYFYLQSGAVVHARVGDLRGIDAVYFALTQRNASFTFSPAFEAPEHSINQPWTSVVLEGLRRMDEGIRPPNPFPEESASPVEEIKSSSPIEEITSLEESASPVEEIKSSRIEEIKPSPVEAKPKVVKPVVPQAEKPTETPRPRLEKPPQPSKPPAQAVPFLSQVEPSSRFAAKPWKLGLVFAAIVLIVGVVAVPWGWYARSKAAKLANETKPVVTAEQPASTSEAAPSESPAVQPETEGAAPAANQEAADLARHQREARLREEARVREKAADSTALLPGQQPSTSVATQAASKPQTTPSAGAKKVTVQVTYDENGRVTQASGGDATALRIARQKRFPAGKAGSATITIPIN